MSIEKDKFLANFSKNFKQFRKNKGLSCQKISQETGIPRATVNSYELGTEPSGFFIAQMFKAYPDDIYWLLTGKRPKTITATEEERKIIQSFRKAPEKYKKLVKDALDLLEEEK